MSGYIFPIATKPIVFNLFDIGETWWFDISQKNGLFHLGTCQNAALRIRCRSDFLLDLLTQRDFNVDTNDVSVIGDLDVLDPIIVALKNHKNTLSIRLGRTSS